MITMQVARTGEIDDLETALAEIKSQIDFAALKKNSGGLIFCHIDFVEEGIVEALCREMPFDVIGMTSIAAASAHGYGLFDLTFTVLTSDEVSFKSGMTGNISRENFTSEIGGLYKEMRAAAGGEPGLVISFAPYVRDLSGNEVLMAMDAAAGGVPIWGGITNDLSFHYDSVQTICNGKHLPDALAWMFLNGPVNPAFVTYSIPERNIGKNRAIVTKSEGTRLFEVNDMPALEFMESIGLVTTIENIITMPFMAYFNGSAKPVALGFYTIFEDGSVLTAAEIPAGTPIAVGIIDTSGVLESAQAGLDYILSCEGRGAALLMPCMSRYISLAPNQGDELELIIKKLGEAGFPFVTSYSGGEICPAQGADGRLYNRFHNYTFCACVL